jgi:hypothetical protein
MKNSLQEQKKITHKCFLIVVLLLLSASGVGSQGMTYQSIMVKDLDRLTPATSFSKSDKIYLYTTWIALTGRHEIKVLWIRPDNKIQETTRLKIDIPPKTQTYTTWAWLSFKKGLLDFMSSDAQFIGPWKARLFLDDTFLKEYAFSVL